MITILTFLTKKELIDAQLVCRGFYEDKVPQAFTVVRIPRNIEPNTTEEIESIIEKCKNAQVVSKAYVYKKMVAEMKKWAEVVAKYWSSNQVGNETLVIFDNMGVHISNLPSILQDLPNNIKFTINSTDITEWEVTLLGPKNSPYRHGLFKLNFKFPMDYPFKPMKV